MPGEHAHDDVAGERKGDPRVAAGQTALDDRSCLLGAHLERQARTDARSHRGLGVARADHRHHDAALREGQAQPFAEQAHCGLAAAVGGRARRAVEAGERAHQRQLTAAAGRHGRLGRLDRVEDAAEVDREDRPGAFWSVWQMPARGAGVGDHEIERRIVVDPADPGGHRGAVGHVDARLVHLRAGAPAFRRHTGETARIAPRQRQMGTWSGIAPRQCGADPAAGAGDQDRARR